MDDQNLKSFIDYKVVESPIWKIRLTQIFMLAFGCLSVVFDRQPIPMALVVVAVNAGIVVAVQRTYKGRGLRAANLLHNPTACLYFSLATTALGYNIAFRNTTGPRAFELALLGADALALLVGVLLVRRGIRKAVYSKPPKSSMTWIGMFALVGAAVGYAAAPTLLHSLAPRDASLVFLGCTMLVSLVLAVTSASYLKYHYFVRGMISEALSKIGDPTVSERFQREIERLGRETIVHPIHGSFPFCIRFEIGTGNPYEKGRASARYVKEALDRVTRIAEEGFDGQPDLLAFELDFESGEGKKAAKFLSRILNAPPTETTAIPTVKDSKGREGPRWLYWELSGQHPDLTDLYREIILAHLGGGLPALASSVHLLDLERHRLLHLYDDRGLDLVVADPESLEPLARKFSGWVLVGNNERVDATTGGAE
jgi:hypothetical protein